MLERVVAKEMERQGLGKAQGSAPEGKRVDGNGFVLSSTGTSSAVTATSSAMGGAGRHIESGRSTSGEREYTGGAYNAATTAGNKRARPGPAIPVNDQGSKQPQS